jgi:hypothetical protein
MKKLTIYILGFLAAINCLNAQNAKDVFNAKEIVWYGMDFTKAKFVGQFDQGFGAMPAAGSDMKTKWVPGWNSLIVSEPQNFDLKKALKIDNIYFDVTPVNNINSKMDADKCMSLNPGTIEKSDIDAMIKKYATGDKKAGIGLVFIVENFNKGTETADIYVTFFDIATKKVLITEKMSGKAMGVGMRNYWAGSVKSIIKQIGKEFKDWKNKY